jgi:AcrR family transcriptional regulator
LPRLVATPLSPRKTPVQRRSAVTVDAILDAALQVLVRSGKERLTTTLVAARAGVSVGTLYQYFPNKSSLLQACLRRHMEQIVSALEQVADGAHGASLREVAEAVVSGYLAAKLSSARASAALYAVSSDVDGMAISRAAMARGRAALERALLAAREPLAKAPETVAVMISAAMNGTAHRLLESRAPERDLPVLRAELLAMVHSYLETCTTSRGY